MKALIIDDEIDICYLLSGMLTYKKMEVDYVTCLADAVVAIEKFKPEIIFLDNRLPDGKGVDFAGYIKKAIPDVQVAMITAYDTPADKRTAEQKKLLADNPSVNINAGVLYQYNQKAADECQRESRGAILRHLTDPMLEPEKTIVWYR